jgi:hypothetical protein
MGRENPRAPASWGVIKGAPDVISIGARADGHWPSAQEQADQERSPLLSAGFKQNNT